VKNLTSSSRFQQKPNAQRIFWIAQRARAKEQSRRCRRKYAREEENIKGFRVSSKTYKGFRNGKC
jgi:hypothetical protein